MDEEKDTEWTEAVDDVEWAMRCARIDLDLPRNWAKNAGLVGWSSALATLTSCYLRQLNFHRRRMGTSDEEQR